MPAIKARRIRFMIRTAGFRALRTGSSLRLLR